MDRCNRCGDKMRQEDLECDIISISYRPLGIDKDGITTLTLCSDCQRDLRNELYTRGLTQREA